jgi:hypothetical protein
VGSSRIACLALIAGACGRAPVEPAPIRFLHTFGAEETELFNAAMAERGIAVDPSLVPFACGQQVIGEILRAGIDCPDLIRIDATWLRSFVAGDLLLPVPEALARLDWTPEAAALGGGHGVPQSVDGLVVVRDRSRPDRERLAVTALARAPRGGQLLVVPRCARRPDEGWRLARELTEIAVAVKFAAGFSTVPTREVALAQAPPLVAAVYRALQAGEPLPRDARTPLLFDDLNPALAAAVARDATAEEAIAGVRRGWKRLALAAGARTGAP